MKTSVTPDEGRVGLSPADRERLTRYLAETRDQIVALTSLLSAEQWSFQPSQHCWSIAAVVEHLVLAEQLFLELVVSRPLDGPKSPVRDTYTEDPHTEDPHTEDARIVQRVAGRASRGEAAPVLRPTGRWTAGELLRFLEGRDRTLSFAQAIGPGARLHVIEHPVLGPLDGYQWALLTAAHTERHAKQIEEIKADGRLLR